MIDPQHPDYANTPASSQRPPFHYVPVDPLAPPLVTVLTPTRNPGPLLHEAATSLFRQSFQQWEWLIVNDGSDDPLAVRRIDSYRDRDPRIRVVDLPTSAGTVAARTRGFAAARSEYVFQLNEEDLLEPTALEKLYWFLEAHPEFAVVNAWEVAFGAREYLWPRGFDRGRELLKPNTATSRALYRRSVHGTGGGFDPGPPRGGEEVDFWLRLAESGHWGHTLPEYLNWFRWREDQAHRCPSLDEADGPPTPQEHTRERDARLEAPFPDVQPRWHMPYERLREARLGLNVLTRARPRGLLIIPQMGLGGAERVALMFMRELVQAGWEVTVAAVTPGEHPWLPQFAGVSPDVFVLPRFLRPTDMPAFLAYLIDSRKPDVVFASGSELGYLLLPYLRVHCPQPAYVDYLHSEAIHWKNGGYARYAAAYHDHVDLTLTTSRHLAKHVVERGADADRVDVLYVNVDTDFWRPDAARRAAVRAEFGIADDEPVILFAGRLQEEKQPRVLGAVLCELAARGAAFSALLAGDGPERPWLEEHLRGVGLAARVRLLGDVPSERVRDLMNASDIFFLPSMFEGIALSIYEAMACGMVVVGADVGGQRELVTPDCGLLLPKATPAEETAAYVDALAGLLGDEARRRRLGAAARQRVCTQFSLPQMRRRFFEMLARARQLHENCPRPLLPLRSAREWATLAVEFTRVEQVLDWKWGEAARLSKRVAELEASLTAKTAEADRIWRGYCEERDRAAAATAQLEQASAQLEQATREYAQINTRLQEIVNSTGWRVLQWLYKIRFFLFPRGSLRERAAKKCMQWQRAVRRHARERTLFRALGRKLRLSWSAAEGAGAGPVASDPANGIRAGIDGLVSVILPVYNQADLLRESIESVLTQTYPNFELIVVNDGSRDGVERVLAEYTGHPKVRILTQANQKLPKALSNGFEFARGEFWTWTSADNLMEPLQLERMVAFLRANPDAQMVYADYLAIDDRGQPLLDPKFRPHNRRSEMSPEIHLPRDTSPLNTVEDNFIGAAFMYRGWTGRLLGDYSPALGVEDYDYWMRMNTLFRIRHIGTDELLYRYRVHDNTLNARAGEHRIYERVQRLFVLDKERRAFFQQPWIISADAATREWLSRIDAAPHCVIPLDHAIGSTSPDKVLELVHATTLLKLADTTPAVPDSAPLLAWFDGDPALPYRCAPLLGQQVRGCFAEDERTLARLEIFTPRAWQAARGPAMLQAAVARANDDTFFRRQTPAVEAARTLPRVLRTQNAPLRVLLQVDAFAQGGLEQVVLDVAGVLRDHEMQVTLLVLGRQGPAMAEARRCDIACRTLPEHDREAAYRDLLVSEQFDLVNAHYSLFGAPIAKELGIPFVQTVHNTYVWLTETDRAAHRAADAYTAACCCVSSAAALYADVRLGLDPRRMIIVPNGVDTLSLDTARAQTDRAAERRRLRLDDEDFVLLHVASIYPPKAHHLLIEALRLARVRDRRIKVAFLGRAMDAAYAERVRRQAEDAGLNDAVLWLGYKVDSQKYYFICDGFVLPSFVEGWSLALAEALYAGLPIVASAVGSAPDVLDPGRHVLVPPPFAGIEQVDASNWYSLLEQPHPDYVQRLAEALLSAVAQPAQVHPTGLAARRLDRRWAYQAYVRIFEWLVAGGAAISARPWVWELHDASRVVGAAERRTEAGQPQVVGV